MRSTGPLRAAGVAAAFLAGAWLIDYVVMPAVLWAVLALFGAVPA